MAGANPNAFQCPNCAANIKITAVGQSLVYVCLTCQSAIDLSKEKFGEFIRDSSINRGEPKIPLGTRGKFRGVLWEVIGFLVRSDGNGAFYWEEYLLFNPMHGFRWLTQFDGHWNYVTPIKEKPVVYADGSSGGAHVYGKDYLLFHKGSAVVRKVLGEFYWRVKTGEKFLFRIMWLHRRCCLLRNPRTNRFGHCRPMLNLRISKPLLVLKKV